MAKAKQQAQRVVVRTFSAGVHYGTLVKRDGKEVTLRDSRRLWQWQGAFTLHAVATRGISSASKISCVLPGESILTEAIEVLPCTPEAVASLDACPEHKP